MNMVQRAGEFAQDYHKDQKYGEESYFFGHLGPMANYVNDLVDDYQAGRLGITREELIAAILLHDTIEDTAATYDQIATEFSLRVADVVDAVTDEREGKSRTERKARTYWKIRSDEAALFVKLVDRLFNVGASVVGNKPIGKMYLKERWSFHGALWMPDYHSPLIPVLWTALDLMYERLEEQRNSKVVPGLAASLD